MVFIRMINEINDFGGALVGDAWDWFVSSTNTPVSPRKAILSTLQKKESSPKVKLSQMAYQLKAAGIDDFGGNVSKDMISRDLD
jgi:hypothetical protein